MGSSNHLTGVKVGCELVKKIISLQRRRIFFESLVCFELRLKSVDLRNLALQVEAVRIIVTYGINNTVPIPYIALYRLYASVFLQYSQSDTICMTHF